MKVGNLNFGEVKDNKYLIADSTYSIIEKFKNKFSVLVAEIDEKYLNGIELCDYYNIEYKLGANCLIVECKRADKISYAALIVPVGYKYNMSNVVRKYTNSRMVSVAPLEFVLEKTGMEYGSINPIGIPDDWNIFIDPLVLKEKNIICGSGKKKGKLYIQSSLLIELKNSIILENLAKE